MNKLIIKTAVATLVSVLAVGLISLIVLTCFFPKTLADFNYKLGNEKLSIYYSELNYKKTGDIEDLEELIAKIHEAEHYEKCVDYSNKMLENEEYFEGKEDYKAYIVSELAVALYKTGYSKADCMQIVSNYLQDEDKIQLIQTVLDKLQ